jgi:hypothetical protein
MGVGRWVRDRLDHDDGSVDAPDAVVTVAQVNAVVATIVLVRLADVGIEARSVDLHTGYHGMPLHHVMCFARDRDAAVAIVEEVLTEEA